MLQDGKKFLQLQCMHDTLKTNCEINRKQKAKKKKIPGFEPTSTKIDDS